jgi:hypothetical protein
VEGGISIHYKGNRNIDEIFTKDDNLKVNCSEYIIENSISDISKWEGGFAIKTGASDGYISIKTENNGRYDFLMVKVQGTEESLKRLDKNHVLLVPNKEE